MILVDEMSPSALSLHRPLRALADRGGSAEEVIRADALTSSALEPHRESRYTQWPGRVCQVVEKFPRVSVRLLM